MWTSGRPVLYFAYMLIQMDPQLVISSARLPPVGDKQRFVAQAERAIFGTNKGCDSTLLNRIAWRLRRRGALGNGLPTHFPQPTQNIDSSSIFLITAGLACWLDPCGHISVCGGFSETLEGYFSL